MPGSDRRPTFAALGDVISLGGDSDTAGADTTGAIVGALAGASAGERAIPREWLAIMDYPRSVSWVRALGARVRDRRPPLRLWWPVIPLRNAVLAAVVLATGLRRLFPPY